MRHKLTFAIAIALLAVVQLEAAAQDRRWLSYEPATVELEGRLVTQLKYGPPNYGEQPKTDQKGKVPILVLTDPINVRGVPGHFYNAESVEGIRQIQLAFINIAPVYKELIGKDVIVKGTLFHAHTGHHYTDVVLDVRSIEGKPSAGAPEAVTQSKPDPCPDAITQLDLNRCSGEQFRKSDKRLNEVYKRILAQLKSADRTNLIQAQRAWLKYRAGSCWAERQFKGGSLAPTREAFCLQDITEARIKELIRIYETSEG
jgi:uncharacterized protein YecT (DUF1311 family)